jgi:hypothetical protein
LKKEDLAPTANLNSKTFGITSPSEHDLAKYLTGGG